MARSGVALCLALGLSACAVGPDFERPAVPKSVGYLPASAAQPAATANMGKQGQQFDSKLDIANDWWTVFQSPQLNALITRALKQSPSIESANAALRQAAAYVDAQRGYFYPGVAAGVTSVRNKVAGNTSNNVPGQQANGQFIGGAPNTPVYYNFHTAQLNIGYVPDVFGGNRRAVESLAAQQEAQRYQLEAVRLTLVCNLVAAALQEAALRAQIDAQETVVGLNQGNLNIMQKQLQLGHISRLDLAAQESSLALSEQMLIPMRRQLAQTRDLLRALSGSMPDEELPETFDLQSLHLPDSLPLTLPSQLVEQRPDIRIAEARYHAATAQVGVAEAARFPQFALSAAVGGMASDPAWVFRQGASFFNALASVSQSLFDGGTLSARQRAAQAGLEQAAADYRGVVITAFQNVADTLYAIQSDAEFQDAADRTTLAMQQTRDLTRKNYDAGNVSYQLLLLAEQNYQQARISQIQARTNRLGDAVALYQALGGGWWNSDSQVAAKVGTGAVQ